jgi:hypothetical protein
MVLLLARAPSTGARLSSPLVVLLLPRVTASLVGALVAPRRSPPPGSRAAAWPQRQSSATPAGRVAERQRWRRRSHPRWRVSCCRTLARMPVALVRGRAAGRQPAGARVGRRSLHGAPPARGCLVQAVGRGLSMHAQLLVKKGQLLVELAPRLREFVEPRPPLGVGGTEPALVRSCSLRRPRRRCIPVWGHAIVWFVPSESS